MTAVVVGASAGVGRALAWELARRRHDLLLVSREEQDVDAVARDLRLRFGVRATPVAVDLATPRQAVRVVVAAGKNYERIDALLLPAGAAVDEDHIGADPDIVDRLVAVNFLSIALLAAEFFHRMAAEGGGSIVGFGSIAAARGRSRNVVYAASKRALTSYFESLRHAAAGSNVSISFYELGFVATQASFGRRLLVPPTTAERVARHVVARYHQDRGTVYFPWYWRPLTMGVRLVPWLLFRRMSF